jgi:hypothetical protein
VRHVAFIYAVAFSIGAAQAISHTAWGIRIRASAVQLTGRLVSHTQYVPLLGEQGLTPARRYMARLRKQLGTSPGNALRIPTVFWFIEPTDVRASTQLQTPRQLQPRG